MIVNWVEGGAPMGNPKDLPSGSLLPATWQLGPPDVVLKPKSDFKVSGDADLYQTFVIPTGLRKDTWISAVDLSPGNAAVVHCASIYEDIKTPGGSTGKGVGSNLSLIGVWVPGQQPQGFPSGTGLLLPAGSEIFLKIHYRG